MSLRPEVRWAEREDKVYLTVMLADAKDVKVNLHPDGIFTFSGTAGADNKCYELKLELFAKVDVEDSMVNIGAKMIVWILMKAEKKWWKKLLRRDGKSRHYIKVDWDKWVEDDDDEVPADIDIGGMKFLKFSAMAGGLGGDSGSMDVSMEISKLGAMAGGLGGDSGGINGSMELSKFGAIAGGLGGDSGSMGSGSGCMDGGTGQGDNTGEDLPDMSDLKNEGSPSTKMSLGSGSGCVNGGTGQGDNTGEDLPDMSDFKYEGSPSTKMSLRPEVRWAEREDKVCLTVMLADAKDVKSEHPKHTPFLAKILEGLHSLTNNGDKIHHEEAKNTSEQTKEEGSEGGSDARFNMMKCYNDWGMEYSIRTKEAIKASEANRMGKIFPMSSLERYRRHWNKKDEEDDE